MYLRPGVNINFLGDIRCLKRSVGVDLLRATLLFMNLLSPKTCKTTTEAEGNTYEKNIKSVR